MCNDDSVGILHGSAFCVVKEGLAITYCDVDTTNANILKTTLNISKISIILLLFNANSYKFALLTDSKNQSLSSKSVRTTHTKAMPKRLSFNTSTLYSMTLAAAAAMMLTSVPDAGAQMRRVAMHTTDQSIAMAETCCARQQPCPQQHRGTEILEVYDFESVDTPPTFPGGYNAMVHFINSSRRYPAEAYARRIEGRVLCSFVVQPDGSVTHINVLRGIEPSLDREALRILDGMPRWEAGRNCGAAVPVYCILPVTFRL